MKTFKRLRIRARLTQTQVAELIGVSQPAVAKWDKGQSPALKHAIPLGALLGVDFRVFLPMEEARAKLAETIPERRRTDREMFFLILRRLSEAQTRSDLEELSYIINTHIITEEGDK